MTFGSDRPDDDTAKWRERFMASLKEAEAEADRVGTVPAEEVLAKADEIIALSRRGPA